MFHAKNDFRNKFQTRYQLRHLARDSALAAAKPLTSGDSEERRTLVIGSSEPVSKLTQDPDLPRPGDRRWFASQENPG